MRSRPKKPSSPLERHIRARGMTQKDLAAALGVKPSAVCNWCAGHYKPEPSKYPRLAQFLGIDAIAVAEVIDQCGQTAA